MTIHQLAKPCFLLDPSPYDSDEYIPHSATWHEADEELRTLREERGPAPEDLAEIETVKVRREDGPCWVAECNVCDDGFTEDEGGGNHFGTIGDVVAAMAPYGWTGLAPDGAYCPAHRPEGPVPPPPTPAELEAAGQLVIPGVIP
jgi:hypothetical protein